MKWALLILAVVLVAAAVLFGQGRGEQNQQVERLEEIAEQNKTARLALCVFRDDLERRADDSQRFADEIESGVRPKIPGITVADLRRSVRGQRAAIDSLAILDCKEKP